MPSSLNKIQLIGNLGRDPEARALSTGTRIVNLNVATTETWKDRNSGERKQATEWHRVTVWEEHTADFCDKYLRKGDRVYIEGKLETRKWQDQSGQDRYSTEIHVRNYGGQVMSLERPAGGGDQSEGGYSGGGGRNQGTGRLRERAQTQDRQPNYADELNDEIPF